MNYDDWRSTEPDDTRWLRQARCQKVSCDNPLTFPDVDVYCDDCRREMEDRAKKFQAEAALYENQVRR